MYYSEILNYNKKTVNSFIKTISIVSLMYLIVMILSVLTTMSYASDNSFICNPLLNKFNLINIDGSKEVFIRCNEKENTRYLDYLFKSAIRYNNTYISKEEIKTNKKILKLGKAIEKINPYIPNRERYQIAKYIVKYTKNISWPSSIDVASIINIESTFNKNAVSYSGSKGLMQLSPAWSSVWPPAAFNTIKYNIKYGVKLLHDNYLNYHKNKYAAILVYNSGPQAYNNNYASPAYFYRYKMAKYHIHRLIETV